MTYNNQCCLFSGFCHHLQAKELACPCRSVQQILLLLTHPSKSTETTNQPNKRSASWRTALVRKVARKNWKLGRDILKLTAYHSAISLGVFSLGLKSTKYGKRLCWAGVINVPFPPISVYLCCECLWTGNAERFDFFFMCIFFLSFWLKNTHYILYNESCVLPVEGSSLL